MLYLSTVSCSINSFWESAQAICITERRSSNLSAAMQIVRIPDEQSAIYCPTTNAATQMELFNGSRSDSVDGLQFHRKMRYRDNVVAAGLLSMRGVGYSAYI